MSGRMNFDNFYEKLIVDVTKVVLSGNNYEYRVVDKVNYGDFYYIKLNKKSFHTIRDNFISMDKIVKIV
jgi:cellobiose phosphorylase